MSNIIIDKIDKKSGISRVEFYGVMIEIPVEDLPRDVREGDGLSLTKSSWLANKEKAINLERKLFG